METEISNAKIWHAPSKTDSLRYNRICGLKVSIQTATYCVLELLFYIIEI